MTFPPFVLNKADFSSNKAVDFCAEIAVIIGLPMPLSASTFALSEGVSCDDDDDDDGDGDDAMRTNKTKEIPN